jgi:hypothetical protein
VEKPNGHLQHVQKKLPSTVARLSFLILQA